MIRVRSPRNPVLSFFKCSWYGFLFIFYSSPRKARSSTAGRSASRAAAVSDWWRRRASSLKVVIGALPDLPPGLLACDNYPAIGKALLLCEGVRLIIPAGAYEPGLHILSTCIRLIELAIRFWLSPAKDPFDLFLDLFNGISISPAFQPKSADHEEFAIRRRRPLSRR
jgi:hypothetical protein